MVYAMLNYVILTAKTLCIYKKCSYPEIYLQLSNFIFYIAKLWWIYTHDKSWYEYQYIVPRLSVNEEYMDLGRLDFNGCSSCVW